MSIHVHIRLAEPFWRAAGQRDLDLELEGHPLVKELLELLQVRFPDLGRELTEAPPIIFIGEQEVSHQSPLTDGDLVHLVWPVAGGAGELVSRRGWKEEIGLDWPARVSKTLEE